MKKKTAITLLTAIITICCMIVFAACGSGCNDLGGEDYEIGSDSNGSGGVNDEIGGDTHEHTFSKQWSNDETYHWHAATCEHTSEVRDKAEHTFANGVCTVCSYRQPTAGLTYTLSYDGYKYSVSGIGTATEKNIFIPSEYNGMPVTGIGSYAFDGCTSIASVTIPSSVTSIGESAFNNCTSLTSVAIPDSVYSIDKNAFSFCTSLNSVYITDIAAWCGIDFANVGSNPLSYANNLYLNNELVTDLTIPSSVTRICDYAFSGCDSLTSVTVPSSVNSIGDNAFSGCTSVANVIIQNGVKRIGEAAFNRCTSLTNVNIRDGVTSIDEGAFSYCTSLTSIAIPSSVMSVGQWAFNNCTSLNDVYITNVAAWCNIYFAAHDSNPLSYANNLYLNNELVTDLTIPSSVTRICDYAFSGCDSLTSVTVPSSMSSIGNHAFCSCDSLTSVIIQNDVKRIGDYAFYECTSLASVSTLSNVTSIGDWAFWSCVSLTSIDIPESVTSIGSDAFENCTSITSITIPSSVTSIGNHAFYGCSALTIYCETDSKPNGWEKTWDGSNPVVWSCKTNEVASDGNIYAVIDGVRYALRGGEATVAAQPINISAITIPTSVTYKNNTYNVTSIGDYAFKDCTLLTSITIPSSVTSIGILTLSNCNSLKSLTVASGNTVYHSAGNCVIETASKALVAGCKNSVIPSDGSVTSISYSAFRDCEYLTSVTIPSSVTIIDDYAFMGCTYLKSVAILGDVTSISEFAFSWCTYLESITIPSSVTSICNYAFNGCAHLTSIYYEGTAEQWNEISIGDSNSLADATCYYYSETNPFEGAGAVTEGNYWHYVDGVPTVWAK